MKSELSTGATGHGSAGRAVIAYAVDADVPTRLQTGYQLLTQFDAALRQAARRLNEAHERHGQQGSCVLELFREVQFLRTASQQVLHDLADVWVSEPCVETKRSVEADVASAALTPPCDAIRSRGGSS